MGRYAGGGAPAPAVMAGAIVAMRAELPEDQLSPLWREGLREFVDPEWITEANKAFPGLLDANAVRLVRSKKSEAALAPAETGVVAPAQRPPFITMDR